MIGDAFFVEKGREDRRQILREGLPDRRPEPVAVPSVAG